MRMPWEDDINWDNTATTIVKGEPMSNGIIITLIICLTLIAITLINHK